MNDEGYANLQVTTEEQIADIIFDRGEGILNDEGVDEEVCSDLGRSILLHLVEKLSVADFMNLKGVLTLQPAYATSFTPTYAQYDQEYSPWVLNHADSAALSPSVIEAHFEDFLARDDVDPDSPEILDDFYGYLNELGYGTFQHPEPPTQLDVPDYTHEQNEPDSDPDNFDDALPYG